MSRYRRLPSIGWRTRSQRRRETAEEIEAHLQMRIDDLILQGVPPAEARERAIARFGELSRARAEIEAAARHRDRRLEWSEWLDGVRRDLVVAGRRIRSDPGHALLGVLIFSFGIGLTTVMYSLVDGVLLRPLPFPEPDRLVALQSVPESGNGFPWVSMGNWYDWRELNGTLESTALYSSLARDATIATGDGAFSVPSVSVYGAFFETLRPPFAAGAAPTEAVAQEGRDIVVVSESFWRRVMGAEPLDGRTVTVNGRPREVVGVIRGGYEYPERVDVWIPGVSRPLTGGARNNINYRAVARLAPAVDRDRAEADLSAIAAGIRARDPEGVYSWGVGVQPLHETVVGDARGYLVMLMGAVSLVLLIACANLAALGFARGRERTGEVAIRLSIGAGRGRIVRQLLTEELVLAGLGGVIGVGVAWMSTGVLLDWVGTVVPRVGTFGFDRSVLGVGLAVSLAAGTAAGLPPALAAARRGGGRLLTATRPIRRGRALPGALLVGSEVALTVLLLTGSALLLMSLRAVTSRDLGYDPAGVVTVDVTLVSPEYNDDNERVLAYWDAVAAELRASADTEVVGLGNWIPTTPGGRSFIEVAVGSDPMAGANYRLVSEDYFRTLGIPIRRGRGVTAADRLGGEPVTVINQAMADEYWPGSDPIGQLVRAPSMEGLWFGGEAPWRTVVGIVGDIRHGGFESDARSEMYVPYRQVPWMTRAMTAIMRVESGEAAARMRVAQERVEALDPALAVDVATLESRVGGRLAERRLVAGLLSGFALAALGLASLGVYGVLSFAVQRRTREVAVRAALGAPRGRLVRLVLGGALRVVALGTLVGLLLATAGTRVLDSLLVDVEALDPMAYLGAGVCLLLVALAAAAIPAHRASRLDPLEALRES